MKKILAALLCIALLLCFCSCYPDAAEETETIEDYTSEIVYVSQYGKIHNNKRCSGMKYYEKMSYQEAIEAGYELCQNCY